MITYKVVIGYDGSQYAGFQIQKRQETVQGVLSESLETIYKEPVKIIGSGRTDSGVHSTGQVISFVAPFKIGEKELKSALVALLKNKVWIFTLEEVEKGFNARFNAKKRIYRYLFSDTDTDFILDKYIVTDKYIRKENFKKLNQFLSSLQGPMDFTNFINNGSSANTSVRTIYDVKLKPIRVNSILQSNLFFNIYEFIIIADGFLYRMVRNLMGLNFELLKGRITVEKARSLFSSVKLEKRPYRTAPAKGLCLQKISY